MSNVDPSTDNPVISVSAEIGRVPSVTEFVENTSIAMGLGSKEAMALTLASEEVFAYLCRSVTPDYDISVSCSDGSYYVRLDFLFDASDIDIGAFNLTSTVSPDDESSLDEMGLLIASRLVDRFSFRQNPGEPSRLTLICDKHYSASATPTGKNLDECALDGDITISSPLKDGDKGYGTIESFARSVWALSSTIPVPAFFEYPEKLADMIRSGEFAIGIAQDANSGISGGIVWTRGGAKTVECFGPYLFAQVENEDVSSKLVDFCLADIARTSTVGLLNRFPASLPSGYFESLGQRELRDPNGSVSAVTVSFRQTKDDPGCRVRTDSGIEGFLREKYSEFAFPREVITDWQKPAERSLRSLLATDLDRKAGRATLRPMLAGDDCEQNIADHLTLLKNENVERVNFEMDLGEPWQALFVPALLANSFRPGILLPYAGKGDIVVFQFSRSES